MSFSNHANGSSSRVLLFESNSTIFPRVQSTEHVRVVQDAGSQVIDPTFRVDGTVVMDWLAAVTDEGSGGAYIQRLFFCSSPRPSCSITRFEHTVTLMVLPLPMSAAAAPGWPHPYPRPSGVPLTQYRDRGGAPDVGKVLLVGHPSSPTDCHSL
jgi:hypothetical protein